MGFKRIVTGVLFGAFALLACAPAEPRSAAPGSDSGDRQLIAQVDEGQVDATTAPKRFSKQRAMIHVRKLATKIGVRVKGTRAEKKGARYIKSKFEGFGYEVEMQKFQVDGKTSRNVVARWPGSRKYPFVVGAHMDSVPGSPGANDNASGTSAVLELARIFAGQPQAELLTFVAFGSEEYGAHRSHHDGSYHFVEQLGEKGRNRLAGMLSVDMIADGRPLRVGHSDIAHKPVVARTVFNKMRKAGFSVSFITLCDCSDHGPFEHAGIPAGFAYSGNEPDYHSSSDVVANMKPNDLLRTGRAVRAFLLHLDKAMLDRFRRA